MAESLLVPHGRKLSPRVLRLQRVALVEAQSSAPARCTCYRCMRCCQTGSRRGCSGLDRPDLASSSLLPTLPKRRSLSQVDMLARSLIGSHAIRCAISEKLCHSAMFAGCVLQQCGSAQHFIDAEM